MTAKLPIPHSIDDLLALHGSRAFTVEMSIEEEARLVARFRERYGLTTPEQIDQAVDGPLHITELGDLWISLQSLKHYLRP